MDINLSNSGLNRENNLTKGAVVLDQIWIESELNLDLTWIKTQTYFNNDEAEGLKDPPVYSIN